MVADCVEVRYKCACMADEAVVRLPYRQSAEDVVDWVENTMAVAISADHRARSPLCTRKATEYVKIPVPENAPWVGGKPELQS